MLHTLFCKCTSILACSHVNLCREFVSNGCTSLRGYSIRNVSSPEAKFRNQGKHGLMISINIPPTSHLDERKNIKRLRRVKYVLMRFLSTKHNPAIWKGLIWREQNQIWKKDGLTRFLYFNGFLLACNQRNIYKYITNKFYICNILISWVHSTWRSKWSVLGWFYNLFWPNNDETMIAM